MVSGADLFFLAHPDAALCRLHGDLGSYHAAVLAVLVQRWRETKGILPWNGIIAYLTTLYLWVIFVRVNPLVLAVVPTFHSLQYLAVVWRYQINAGSQPRTSAPPPQSSAACCPPASGPPSQSSLAWHFPGIPRLHGRPAFHRLGPAL